MIITTEHDIGDIVYIKTDIDQLPRMVVGITIRSGPMVSYEISCGSEDVWKYDIELSKTKNSMTIE